MKSKQIIINHAEIEILLVLSSLLLHSNVAGKSRVKSAGFCELNAYGKWLAGGKPDSL